MRKRTGGMLLGSLLLAAVPGGLSAQLYWDSPPLINPNGPNGMSVFVGDFAPGSDNLGGMARWQQGPTGYRVGLGEEAGTGDVAVFGGIDVNGVLADNLGGEAMDVLWWGGAGVGIGSDFVASFPLGLAIGWFGTEGKTAFSPYAGGHLALDIGTGAYDGADLSATFDLGLDLTTASGWMIRFNASFAGVDERRALAVGFPVPSGS